MNARHLSSSILTALAVALGTGLALSVSNAHAGEIASQLDPKEVERVETTSVGSGFLLGAAVGGPPGAVVGAIAGALIGDRVLVGRKNTLLETSLESTREELLAMQQANERLQAQLLASRSTNAQNLVASTSRETQQHAACCADSELVLHFRSGSSEVEDLYAEELKQFVGYVQSVPDAIVEIYGYADRRGEQNDNLWLSQERVQSVEKTLRELGLKNFTYETTALGEGQPATRTDTLEHNFFDRRVVLRVRKDQATVASSTR